MFCRRCHPRRKAGIHLLLGSLMLHDAQDNMDSRVRGNDGASALVT